MILTSDHRIMSFYQEHETYALTLQMLATGLLSGLLSLVSCWCGTGGRKHTSSNSRVIQPTSQLLHFHQTAHKLRRPVTTPRYSVPCKVELCGNLFPGTQQPSHLMLQVKVWTVSSAICIVTFTDHAAAVTGLQWLPSGSAVLSCSLDGTVRAFDLVRYRNFRTFTTPTAVQLSSMAADPSGEVSVVPVSAPSSATSSLSMCPLFPVYDASSPHHCGIRGAN